MEAGEEGFSASTEHGMPCVLGIERESQGRIELDADTSMGSRIGGSRIESIGPASRSDERPDSARVQKCLEAERHLRYIDIRA